MSPEGGKEPILSTSNCRGSVNGTALESRLRGNEPILSTRRPDRRNRHCACLLFSLFAPFSLGYDSGGCSFSFLLALGFERGGFGGGDFAPVIGRIEFAEIDRAARDYIAIREAVAFSGGGFRQN